MLYSVLVPGSDESSEIQCFLHIIFTSDSWIFIIHMMCLLEIRILWNRNIFIHLFPHEKNRKKRWSSGYFSTYLILIICIKEKWEPQSLIFVECIKTKCVFLSLCFWPILNPKVNIAQRKITYQNISILYSCF